MADIATTIVLPNGSARRADMPNDVPIRDLIEEYRLLFIEWVAGFDKWDYIIDRWGLFNPPGVGPFDKDPDDDIPFHGFEEDPEE